MRLRIVVSAVALALASLAWTAGAVADNPHGTPPGQAKASASTSTNASANASAGAKAQAKGHAKVHATGTVSTTAHARGHAKTTTGATVQSQAGVKPASNTGFNTYAPAASTNTKLYGNGTTAGQIATQSGFSSSNLYGPGNSQPHKTNCGPHSIDVHALKAHQGACGGTVTTSVKLHGKAHAHLSAKLAAAFAAAAGVQPFNGNGHNTFALASSKKTKLYGNGETAGQIAMAAGYTGMLFGPGNSQPHKATCGTHSIDVHALKAHGGASACNAASTTESTQATVATSVAQQQAVAAAAAKQSASTSSSGVLGAKASAHAKKKSSGGGVLGATAQLASSTKHVVATAHGSLPFTGLALWLPVALGLALIASGFGLVRRGRTLS